MQRTFDEPDAFVRTKVNVYGGQSTELSLRSQGNTHGARNSGSSMSE